MAWYLAPSLEVLRKEVNTRWPNRDKTSDGTIGDEAHQNTSSDHNPNSRESVDAWDMDKGNATSNPNVDEVIAAFMKHPSAHYVIWNRKIADKDTGWKWNSYTGSNPHTEHVHFSIRQSASAEQDTRPWGLLEDDMAAFTDTQVAQIHATDRRVANALITGADSHTTDWSKGNPTGVEGIWITKFLKEMSAKIDSIVSSQTALQTSMNELLQKHDDGQIDAEEVVRRMGELLSA